MVPAQTLCVGLGICETNKSIFFTASDVPALKVAVIGWLDSGRRAQSAAVTEWKNQQANSFS